jgi:hypothetical protein
MKARMKNEGGEEAKEGWWRKGRGREGAGGRWRVGAEKIFQKKMTQPRQRERRTRREGRLAGSRRREKH